MVQGDTPDWAPLTAVVGPAIAEWFMWMFEVRLDDGLSVHAYKHVTTRRYLHLASDGRAFVYCGDSSYRAMQLTTALVRSLGGTVDVLDPSLYVDDEDEDGGEG